MKGDCSGISCILLEVVVPNFIATPALIRGPFEQRTKDELVPSVLRKNSEVQRIQRGLANDTEPQKLESSCSCFKSPIEVFCIRAARIAADEDPSVGVHRWLRAFRRGNSNGCIR